MKKLKRIQALPENATYDEMDSPVGTLTIITTVKGLHAVLWDIDRKNPSDKKIISNDRIKHKISKPLDKSR